MINTAPSERFMKNCHIIGEIDKLKNKCHQLAILTRVLMDEDTWIVKPICEYHVRTPKNEYRIDLYYPSIKLAIEIDEEFHATQIEDDSERQRAIEAHLGCKTHRVKINSTDFIHIDAARQIKEMILNESKHIRSEQEWKINVFDKDRALRDHPGLIFVKSKPEVAFPNFRLKASHRDRKDLTVALVSDTIYPGYIEVTNTFKVLSTKNANNGYVSWDGQYEYNPIITSGCSQMNFSGSPVHALDANDHK